MELKELNKTNIGGIKGFLKKHWKIVFAILYLLSPIDIVPDLIPLLGVSDDLVVLLITFVMALFDHKKNESTKFDKEPEIIEGEIVDEK